MLGSPGALSLLTGGCEAAHSWEVETCTAKQDRLVGKHPALPFQLTLSWAEGPEEGPSPSPATLTWRSRRQPPASCPGARQAHQARAAAGGTEGGK